MQTKHANTLTGTRPQADTSKLESGSVLVITNPTDEHLSNTYARETVDRWQALGAEHVSHYAFDPQLKLMHDIMDPDQPYQQIDMTYPILLDLITGQD